MIELSLILPVYNQEDIIAPVYKTIYQTINKLGISFECILVENGSVDETRSVTQKLAQIYPHTISISTTKGYGSAVISGLEVARGKYFCYMPSDGQVDLSVIPLLWKLAKSHKYKIVKIRRFNRESIIRSFISKLLSSIISLRFQTPSIDINGSPRIIQLDDIKKLHLSYRDSFIDAEMTVKANRLGWNIIEIPMQNLDRFGGKSSRNWKTYLEFIKNVITFNP
jgi:glycosyltransferase involved in cell wall biosynthesis